MNIGGVHYQSIPSYKFYQKMMDGSWWISECKKTAKIQLLASVPKLTDDQVDYVIESGVALLEKNWDEDCYSILPFDEDKTNLRRLSKISDLFEIRHPEPNCKYGKGTRHCELSILKHWTKRDTELLTQNLKFIKDSNTKLKAISFHITPA